MRRVLAVALLVAALTPVAGVAAAPGHRDRVVPCSRGLVALTFDDGPSPTVTPRLVHLLRRLDVPATFFMVGSRVAAYPEVARLVEHNGFAIGNHTWAHTDLTTQTTPEVRHALRATRRAMDEAGLHPTDLARPPYGATNPRVDRLLTAMGYTSVLWTIDSRDWTGLSPRQIRAGIGSAVRPHRTNLVLQHDGVTNSPATLRALPTEIAGLRARGFCFAALDATGAPTPPVPQVEITTARPRVAEGGRLALAVRLSRPTSRPTAVRVQGRTLPFAVGERSARTVVDARQDDRDDHGKRLAITVDGLRGLEAGPAVSVPVVDDDPPPVVSVGAARTTASPLLAQTVTLPVRLDRTSDRDLVVDARSPLGPASTTVPAGSRTAALQLTVPVGTPRDRVRQIPVRIDGAGTSLLVVRPPTQTRAEAVRAAFAGVTWPQLRLPHLF
ncbi:hypothetical protein ASC77_04275 [Nocardioides sp. Root1257]|uniref:polysaccharide deacetylase family protein n=1 Tax=unclassified Nocardioides TaxID=2615069 RepID=UPI0006FA8FB5|nr:MULTISPECIES: polysaccharide deacetylase family protein [unclassified Nocardioides]KQW53504.1 hypothetical protein ASC77_04275 [Nocardioides sp. Root1257]KRC56190.1 hypothetical protein ASE24_04275 [Nocardioides sp. Root224]